MAGSGKTKSDSTRFLSEHYTRISDYASSRKIAIEEYEGKYNSLSSKTDLDIDEANGFLTDFFKDFLKSWIKKLQEFIKIQKNPVIHLTENNHHLKDYFQRIGELESLEEFYKLYEKVQREEEIIEEKYKGYKVSNRRFWITYWMGILFSAALGLVGGYLLAK